MKHFPAKPILAFGLLISLFSFNACQKEGLTPKETVISANPTTDRSPEHRTYGVTVFDGVTPSVIVEIDEATGNVLQTFPATVDNGSGVFVQLVDLKGIARTSWGQFFLTTGPGNFPNFLDNSLVKVNVNGPGLPLGRCSWFNSVCPFGQPVSDLEFDPGTQHFFGLLNNTNQLVEIADNNNNFANYFLSGISGIAPGTTLKGFSIVRDNFAGTYFVGAANRTGNPFVPTKLYTIPTTGALTGVMTDVLPQSDVSGGHCALGFDIGLNHLAINRAPSPGALAPVGLNHIAPWAPPFGPATNTTFWGGAGFNFEDLSSSIY